MPAAACFRLRVRSACWPALLLALLLAPACTRKTPGYCRSDIPCPAGFSCGSQNLCLPSDGGVDSADGSDGSDGQADRSDAPIDMRTDAPVDVPTDVPSDVAPPCTAASCSGGKPVCDPTSKACRGCQVASECAAADAGTPVCMSGGTCVQCVTGADCPVVTKPVCSGNSCQGCTSGSECGAPDAGTPVCATTGACVQCLTAGDCKVATKPICNTTANSCGGCTTAAQCASLSTATPACATTGACVECVTSPDCTVKTKPVCNTATNSCRVCQSDGECPGAPGVCMAHVDGHCATPAEVIYVQNSAGCIDAGVSDSLAGTIGQPLCSMQPVPAFLSPTRNLVVVRGAVAAGTWTFMSQGSSSLSIVGQQSAYITATTLPAFSMQSGSAYLRGVKLNASVSMGISAKGGTLALDTVTVDKCNCGYPPMMVGCMGGGILVDGAAFDIRNTTITNNGPSADLVWGGMRVASLSATGPKNLHLVTIQSNNAAGLSCATGAAIQGDGVLASGNNVGDVTAACGITACSPMSSTCGAP